MRILRRIGRLARRIVLYGLLLMLMLTLLQYSSYPTGIEWNAVALLTGDYQFDYVSWELNALAVKVNETLYGLHPFMTEADRTQYVRDYMSSLADAQRLDAQINTIFADPKVTDAEAASADLRAKRDTLRSALSQKQAPVESILEGQVAQVLIEQGFGIGGQLIPPISAHFTQVPNLLVVSPRDQIRFDVSINLVPMAVDQMAALENSIDKAENVSSLVVPLGGIALYPSMILETSSIPSALDTISHEWLHHYLYFFPLGIEYFTGDSFAGETRIINETTASVFGDEMSLLVLKKYYPDLLPPPAVPSPPGTPVPNTPPAFDFSSELDKTRRQVDTLLAAGKVDEAETYMETEREVFVAHGYQIRKLNQAFFAFYGGYQSGSSAGAGGSDPIGPAVRALRSASPTLHAWVLTMRGITTREQLLNAAQQPLENSKPV